MANKFEKLRFLFNEIKIAIENEPTERNARLALKSLLESLKEIKDPVLASNFQTYWLDITNQIKQLSDENDFAHQKHLIELNIEGIMFPELAQN